MGGNPASATALAYKRPTQRANQKGALERCLVLYRILEQTVGGVTTADLAEELGVSVRSVERYIAKLEAAHYAVDRVTPPMRYRIMRTRVTP